MSLPRRMQLRAARAMLEWSQERLSQISGVSLPTIKRIETGNGEIAARGDTIRRLEKAFSAHGIKFLYRPNIGVEIHISTALADVVAGRRMVIVHMSPDEPPIAISPEDARAVAGDAEQDGNLGWAEMLRRAAEEADQLSLP